MIGARSDEEPNASVHSYMSNVYDGGSGGRSCNSCSGDSGDESTTIVCHSCKVQTQTTRIADINKSWGYVLRESVGLQRFYVLLSFELGRISCVDTFQPFPMFYFKCDTKRFPETCAYVRSSAFTTYQRSL